MRSLPWKTWILPIAAFAAMAFMLGFFNKYHVPRLKSWLLLEIEKQSSKHLPVRIWPQSLEFTYFPPGIELKDVRILPQKELKGLMAPTNIKSLRVSVSLLGLFKGQLRIGELAFEGAEIKLVVEKSEEKEPVKIDLNQIFALPVDNVTVSEVDLWLRLKENEVSMMVEDISLAIENSYRALLMDIETPRIHLKQTGQKPTVNMELSTTVLVRDNRVQLSSLKLKKDGSYLVAAGTIYGNVNKMEYENAILQAKTVVDLQEAIRLSQSFFPEKEFPKIRGKVEFGIDLQHAPNEPFGLDFELGTENVNIDGFEVGNVKAKGVANDNSLSIPNLTWRNSAGEAKIEKAKVTFSTPLWQFKDQAPTVEVEGTVSSKNLQLQKLLEALRVGKVPVLLSIAADLPCKGQVYPTLGLHCTGRATGENLHVDSGGKEAFPIIDLEKFTATGEVTVTAKDVSYKADIAIDSSKGSSQGKISYEQGFKISFDGTIEDMNSIKNLATLDFDGAVKLKGSTQGDSHKATVDIQVDGSQFWLSDYGLGQFTTNVRYKEGVLSFKNVNGHFGSSKYTGSVSLNLLKNRIFVEAKAPFVEASNVTQIFSRKVNLPFRVTGTGSAKVRGSGPLRFNQLSYDFESSFFRGTVANESYDKFFFNVSAKNGHVTAERVEITKGGGNIHLNGEVDSEGIINAKLTGNHLRLEQFDNLNQIGLDMIGQIDFNTSLKGYILKPAVEMSGQITKLVINDRPAEDSKFELKYSQDKFSANGHFVGDTVFAAVSFPFDGKSPFELRARTVDWNFTQFFSIFSSVSEQRGFETRLTSDIRLSAPGNDFWKATGQVNVDQFLLQRGPIFLRSTEPMKIIAENGVWRTDHFRVTGEGTFLELTAKNSMADKLNLALNGKIDMSLLTLFLPFMDDLRGTLSIAAQLQGSVQAPRVLGSAYVQQGLVRLKDFPHPFENLQTDILFNQNNILVNALRARVGGGDLKADGKLTIEGLKKIPADFKGQFDNVTLNVPEGFKTTGSGQIYIRGDSFPYELGGTYEVVKSTVRRNFSQDKNHLQTIKPSSFLPKFLVEESFQPITLRLDLFLRNPADVRVVVSNAEVAAPISGHLRVMNYPDQPLLTGRLTTGPPGQITFRNNIFDIRTGQIEYDNMDPSRPNVYLAAETRVKDEFDVTLNLQGPADNPKINLTSQPSLPEHEIISLLALGITSKDLDTRVESSQQAAQTSFQVGSAVIREQLGINRELESKLGVEFDISSSFDEASNVAVPAFTVKKQWSPKFGASATRTFEESPTNTFKAEYKVNRNLSVVGTFENQDTNKQTTLKKDEKIGLDLEYKIEFK